jgi:putative transposase
MANSFAALHYHFVFSTKNRHRWITPDIEESVWKYLGGIARNNDMVALQVGGIEDHVHAIVGLPASMAPSQALQRLKAISSKWIHETFPNLGAFAWQDGYGAFTVSTSQLPEVIRYVENQRAHHHTMTFQEEFRALLERHDIPYDERYVWG